MNKKRLLLAGALSVITIIIGMTFLFQNGSGNLKGFLNVKNLQKSYTLSSNDVTFLDTLNGSWSNREVTLKNNSLHRIDFSWSELPDSEVISLVNSDNFSLAAGATKTIRFKFAPTENINETYTATAVLSGDGKSKTINLEGNGWEAFHVSPTEVNFLTTVVGSTSYREIEIENFSGNPLEFNISNPISRMYGVEGEHFITVPARSSSTVRFSFTPRVVGRFAEVESDIVYATLLEDGVDLTFTSRGVAR